MKELTNEALLPNTNLLFVWSRRAGEPNQLLQRLVLSAACTPGNNALGATHLEAQLVAIVEAYAQLAISSEVENCSLEPCVDDVGVVAVSQRVLKTFSDSLAQKVRHIVQAGEQACSQFTLY